ncbi:MAG: hypothetical protein ACD_62C00216G0001, partial [uncultured bacterium]
MAVLCGSLSMLSGFGGSSAAWADTLSLVRGLAKEGVQLLPQGRVLPESSAELAVNPTRRATEYLYSPHQVPAHLHRSGKIREDNSSSSTLTSDGSIGTGRFGSLPRANQEAVQCTSQAERLYNTGLTKVIDVLRNGDVHSLVTEGAEADLLTSLAACPASNRTLRGNIRYQLVTIYFMLERSESAKEQLQEMLSEFDEQRDEPGFLVRIINGLSCCYQLGLDDAVFKIMSAQLARFDRLYEGASLDRTQLSLIRRFLSVPSDINIEQKDLRLAVTHFYRAQSALAKGDYEASRHELDCELASLGKAQNVLFTSETVDPQGFRILLGAYVGLSAVSTVIFSHDSGADS